MKPTPAAYVAALERANRALRGESDWQPIETAPKDGTWLLGIEPIVGLNTKYAPHIIMRWRPKSAGRPAGWCLDAGLLCNPTHWQLLPESPKD